MGNNLEQIARHQFDNCKAAFRLLQGALLSGNYFTTVEERKLLWDRFFEIETKHNINQKEVVNFFMSLKQPQTNEEKLKVLGTKLKFEDKQIIVIDDQYHTAGWKEVFEFIFPEIKINDYTSINSLKANLTNPGIVDLNSIMVIIVDLNFQEAENKNAKGIKLISELSKNYPAIPIIAFSAYDSASIVKQSFEAGAWDYFAKEPDKTDSTNSSDALSYYSLFMNIIDKCFHYHKNYYELFHKIHEIELSVKSNPNKVLAKAALENLWMGYKYLVMEEVIRFRPEFFNESRHEEVIFQSAKGYETFMFLVFQSKKIEPRVGGIFKYKIAFGDIAAIARVNSKKLGLDKDWLKKADSLPKLRNKTTHQSSYNKSRKVYELKTDKADMNDAKEFLEAIVDLIHKLT